MNRFAMFLAPIGWPIVALANPTEVAVEVASDLCRDAFLAGDAKAYHTAAATMLAWGEVGNSEWQKEVALCLSLADSLDGADLAVAKALAAEANPEVAATGDALAAYLSRAKSEDSDMPALAEDIATDAAFAPASSPERDELEAAMNDYVRPIPASRAQQNLTAYKALARINPEVEKYQERIERYERAIEQAKAAEERTARRVANSLIKTTADFDGSSWSRHPSSPRYQDTRDYVTLYLIESSSGRKSMELFVNYTSRDGWLFVENAQINIDGERERLPVSRWFRDNDTEIWEWGSIRGSSALDLAERIADSNRAVIRFNGQQFYDDYVVSERDKRVLREMLLAWEVLKKDQ